MVREAEHPERQAGDDERVRDPAPAVSRALPVAPQATRCTVVSYVPKECAMGQEPQPWSGDVRLPGWLRRILRRSPEVTGTPEAAREARKAQASDYAALDRVRATGGTSPHHSELPGGKNEPRSHR
jgi:hypothetical protein